MSYQPLRCGQTQGAADDAPMMRPAIALVSVIAALLVACATTARETSSPRPYPSASAAPDRPAPHQDHPMIPAAPNPALLAGARTAAHQVLTLLSNASLTSDLSRTHIDQQFGVTLVPDIENGDGYFVYRSPELGQGWTYGAQVFEGQGTLKPTFLFWFYNEDQTANSAPVCALPLDQLRSSLTAHGWIERSVPSEIGSVLAIEFAKRELVLTLTPRDVTASGPTQCVLSLHASGGH
jgi:hypothetical protein